jgi:hypothetical protein
MKTMATLLLLALFFSSCKTPEKFNKITNERSQNLTENDTVIINSDENTYEIVIIEPGFNVWLTTVARPRHYYTQSFMETRNEIYVNEWNLRFNQPLDFDAKLYSLPIDYNRYEDYGYEINYKLYNYFIYFQRKYKQRLGPFEPRI